MRKQTIEGRQRESAWWAGGVCLALAAVTIAVFGQVWRHEFLRFDDNVYITENPPVLAGLTWNGVVWAFRTTHGGNWHPLTWLSHMADCELFGLNAGAHHLVNVFFHALNTVLLFLFLRRATGALWPSAFVASLFALHPLHVESVVWAAERKDVLSTTFWMLTLTAYARYTDRGSLKWAVATTTLLGLGLMAKSMAVTLPCVLVLLDYWPFGRLDVAPAQPRHSLAQIWLRLREKWALFGLSAAFCVTTVFAQLSGQAVRSWENFPFGVRVGNAIAVYARYIIMALWPSGLAIFYPHRRTALPLWQVQLSAVALLFITVFVLRFARRAPYLAVGWLWYIGTLVPVIGLVQVGTQAFADRYTYIPLIGLFIMVAWGIPALLGDFAWRRRALAFGGGAVLLAMTIATTRQVRHWRDGVAVFTHAIEVTTDNALAHHGLGLALFTQGRYPEAVTCYAETIRIKPDYYRAHNNLGVALAMQDRFEEAIPCFSEAIRLKPDFCTAYNNLGNALRDQGRLDEAAEQFAEALRLKPDYANARKSLEEVRALQRAKSQTNGTQSAAGS